jgi:galactokinase
MENLMTWRPIDPQTQPLPDSARFFATVNAHAGFFDPSVPLVVARTPGRLDVMGGIADYSGSLVLELPLGVAAFAAAQPAPEPALTIRSLQAAAIDAQAEVTIGLADLAPGGAALAYADARARTGRPTSPARSSRWGASAA